MQPETLQATLTDLSKLNDIATTELEALVAAYPYFQTAHLLLLKKYQISDDPKFQDYLSTAATYAPDRKWLHHFVQEVKVPEVGSDSDEVEAITEQAAETPLVHEDTVDESVSKTIEQEEVALEESDAKEEEIEKDSDEETISEVEVPSDEEPQVAETPKSVADEVLAWLKDRDKQPEEPETEAPQKDSIEEERPEENEIKEELLEPEVPKKSEPEEHDQYPETEEHFPEDPGILTYEERETIPVDKLEPESEPEPEDRPEEDEEPALSAPGGYSFTEWFKHLDEGKKGHTPTKPQETQEAQELDLIDQTITSESAYQVEAQQAKEEPEIETQPQEPVREIPKPFKSVEAAEVDNADLEAVENQAKKSVEWGDEVISETLAKVFVAQGKTQKAIEMYEKLRLKYPEKSDYFASAISKLQDN